MLDPAAAKWRADTEAKLVEEIKSRLAAGKVTRPGHHIENKELPGDADDLSRALKAAGAPETKLDDATIQQISHAEMMRQGGGIE